MDTERQLPAGLYGFDDLRTGDRYSIGSTEITSDFVDRFADLSGDHFAIHMSDEAARELGFERRVAHGLLILALIDGMKNQCPVQVRAVASLGWNWEFRAPVLLGDQISGKVEIIDLKPTSNPKRGIASLEFVVRNAEQVIVQEGVNKLMILR